MTYADMRGHNQPPSTDAKFIRDFLAGKHGKLTIRRDELLASAMKMPRLDSEEIAKRATELVKMLRVLEQEMEAARIAEKAPYLSAGRSVDAFFQAIVMPLHEVKQRVEADLTKYQHHALLEDKLRSDRGALLTTRTNWVFDTINRAELDLEALRPYLPNEGLEKAVRAAIRSGVHSIRGCNIHKEERAQIL